MMTPAIGRHTHTVSQTDTRRDTLAHACTTGLKAFLKAQPSGFYCIFLGVGFSFFLKPNLNPS